MMKNYGIDIWGNENFIIKDGAVCINMASQPSLLKITQRTSRTDHSTLSSSHR